MHASASSPVCRTALFAVLATFALAQLSVAAAPAKPAASSPADDLSTLGMKASVTIIFDTSGSMNERRKLIMAKQAFNWWFDTAPKATIAQWSLWSFDARTRDALRLVDRKANAADEVKAKIGAFTANGGTPLGRTIDRVAGIIDAENRRAELGKADILRQIVLIFTDGADSFLSVPEMQKKITALRNTGAEVFSIGYQGEGGYLAKVSDKFIMVDDERQLKTGLSEFTYFIEKAGKPK
jgi:Mg-chelatase subunit ChlD